MFAQSSIELDDCCEDEKVAITMRLFFYYCTTAYIYKQILNEINEKG